MTKKELAEKAIAFTLALQQVRREDLSEEDLIALSGLLQELQEMLAREGS